tara:strand:- start:3151 stop:3330 length:180 start_codon:yes stop_codon:yes gene_type:complete
MIKTVDELKELIEYDFTDTKLVITDVYDFKTYEIYEAWVEDDKGEQVRRITLKEVKNEN